MSHIYQPRLIDPLLASLLDESPAVLINGPRGVGKTTTARQLAADVVRLDSPSEAAEFRADPDAALSRRQRPLLLDEWQEVPEVLGALKRSVDRDRRPGQFLLTGSVQAALSAKSWPGTGRLINVEMFGLTEREIHGVTRGTRQTFFDKLALDDLSLFRLPKQPPNFVEYVELALRGGFPELAYQPRSEQSRSAWTESYLENLFMRDASSIRQLRAPEKLVRYFQALSLNTAGLQEAKTLIAAADINAKTAEAYDELLTRLFVAERVPAWATNRLKRLIKTPKRYVLDVALAASAAGLTAQSILTEGDLLGRVFDSFAMAQLRPEASLSPLRPSLFHLRTPEGRQEIAAVVELKGGEVLGVEFKVNAAPEKSDAKHLLWLRDLLGSRFRAGAVLHTGRSVYRISERVLAVPLCALWTP